MEGSRAWGSVHKISGSRDKIVLSFLQWLMSTRELSDNTRCCLLPTEGAVFTLIGQRPWLVIRDTGITKPPGFKKRKPSLLCPATPFPPATQKGTEGLRRWVHIDRDRWPGALGEAFLPFVLVCGCHLDGSLLPENRAEECRRCGFHGYWAGWYLHNSV